LEDNEDGEMEGDEEEESYKKVKKPWIDYEEMDMMREEEEEGIEKKKKESGAIRLMLLTGE
jgi:hypothetical protein